MLLVIFVLQLLIPIGMVSYTAYIEWGLENRAAVYKMTLTSVEWMHPDNVYLNFNYLPYLTTRGVYCAVKTGSDGFADVEITSSRPTGNYIRSQSGRYFNMPYRVLRYALQTEVPEDDYRWLYFVPEAQKEEWGWRSTEHYFDEAYAEVHIFKGHAVTKAVFIDGKTIEDHIADCIAIDLRDDDYEYIPVPEN